MPPKDYILRIRSLCDKHDILLITDEVLTGLGWAGQWLAMDHLAQSPTSFASAKG
jgi:adenosylmethionine-8-amino-7-oxononanoate aminotransferase